MTTSARTLHPRNAVGAGFYPARAEGNRKYAGTPAQSYNVL